MQNLRYSKSAKSNANLIQTPGTLVIKPSAYNNLYLMTS